MKTEIFCILTGLSMVAACRAGEPGDFWLGVRGGPSIPRLSGGGNEVSRGYDSILAPNAGLMAEYYVTGQFSLLLEVDYSGQGGERKGLQPITQTPDGVPGLPPGQTLYGDFKNKSLLNYLEIPVMGKYEWSCNTHWRYYIEAGPYVGFLLDATEKTSGTSPIYVDKNGTPLTLNGTALPPVSFDADTNVKGDLHSTNVGIMGGVGTGYLFNPDNEIFLDVRGEYGLTTVQRDTELNGNSHTGSAVLSIGYKHRFSR
jgi:Outer membrane protein beta-barrel domain